MPYKQHPTGSGKGSKTMNAIRSAAYNEELTDQNSRCSSSRRPRQRPAKTRPNAVLARMLANCSVTRSRDWSIAVDHQLVGVFLSFLNDAGSCKPSVAKPTLAKKRWTMSPYRRSTLPYDMSVRIRMGEDGHCAPLVNRRRITAASAAFEWHRLARRRTSGPARRCKGRRRPPIRTE